MEQGERVVKVLHGAGLRTATIQVVESIKDGEVRLVGSSLKFSEHSGREIDPGLPGWYCELIELEQ